MENFGWIASWLLDKLSPAAVSALVAFAILHVGRRRERRKISLEMYKEFYSPEFSQWRYDAEVFFEAHSHQDWRKVDPYTLADPEVKRKGYASVTRFYARLSILYAEKELDRVFIQRTLSRVSGYWWGYVYEEMVERQSMYTKELISYIFQAIRDGSRSDEFAKGYQEGVGRKAVATGIPSKSEVLARPNPKAGQ